MIKTEFGTVERHPSVDQFAWRRFWLANVMREKGKCPPAKNALLTIRVTQRSLSRRLHELRRLQSVAALRHSRHSN
jgi:hypothetical protein